MARGSISESIRVKMAPPVARLDDLAREFSVVSVNSCDVVIVCRRAELLKEQAEDHAGSYARLLTLCQAGPGGRTRLSGGDRPFTAIAKAPSLARRLLCGAA